MLSPKTLLLLAIATAAIWSWQNGIRPADITDALDRLKVPGRAGPAATAQPAPLTEAPGRKAEPIHTWVDAQGVRHFSPASAAPPGSTPHAMGKTTIIHTEITSPAKEEAKKTTPAASPETTPDAKASAQAYELMNNLEAKLEAIRQENNR